MSSSPWVADFPGKLATAWRGAVVGLLGGLAWLVTVATAAIWLEAVVCSLLALLVLALGARHPSYRALTPLGVLAFAPLLFCSARAALATPLIDDVCEVRFGALIPLDWMAIVVLPPLICSGALFFLLARFLVQRERRWFAALLRAASVAVCVGGLVVVVVAAPRVLRHPPPSGHVDSLPAVGVIPPAQGEPTFVKVFDDPVWPSSMGVGNPMGERWTSRIYEHPFAGDLLARRYCSGFSDPDCRLTITGRSPLSDLEARRHATASMRDLSPFYCEFEASLEVAEGTPVLVREDVAHDLLIFETPTLRALQRSSLKMTHVDPDDILDSTSAPRGWFALGVAGVLLAISLQLQLQLQRRRAQRRVARLDAASTGILGEDGWITFDEDRPPLRAPLDMRMPPGPVLVIPGASRGAAPAHYRGQAPPADAEILSGERNDLLARERRELDALVAYPLAIALLTALPLAVETALRMAR